MQDWNQDGLPDDVDLLGPLSGHLQPRHRP